MEALFLLTRNSISRIDNCKNPPPLWGRSLAVIRIFPIMSQARRKARGIAHRLTHPSLPA